MLSPVRAAVLLDAWAVLGWSGAPGVVCAGVSFCSSCALDRPQVRPASAVRVQMCGRKSAAAPAWRQAATRCRPSASTRNLFLRATTSHGRAAAAGQLCLPAAAPPRQIIPTGKKIFGAGCGEHTAGVWAGCSLSERGHRQRARLRHALCCAALRRQATRHPRAGCSSGWCRQVGGEKGWLYRALWLPSVVCESEPSTRTTRKHAVSPSRCARAKGQRTRR